MNKQEIILGQEAICPDGLGRVCNFKEIILGQEAMNKQEIILGQEAICPDGLGRVCNFKEKRNGVEWIQVETYFKDRSCCWDVKNVELIDPRNKNVKS